MEIESDGMHRKNVRPCPRASVLLSFLCNMLLSSNSKNGMNEIQQQRRRFSVFAPPLPSPSPVPAPRSLSLPSFNAAEIGHCRLCGSIYLIFAPTSSLPPKLFSSSAERPCLRVSLTPLFSSQVFYGSRLPREKRFGETRREKMSLVSPVQIAFA